MEPVVAAAPHHDRRSVGEDERGRVDIPETDRGSRVGRGTGAGPVVAVAVVVVVVVAVAFAVAFAVYDGPWSAQAGAGGSYAGVVEWQR